MDPCRRASGGSWPRSKWGRAAVAVVADLLLPSLVLLGVAGVSLGIRRRASRPWACVALVGPGAWWREWHCCGRLVVFVQLALIMPITNLLTGKRQDLSRVRRDRGRPGHALVFLVLAWSLAAVGEESRSAATCSPD